MKKFALALLLSVPALASADIYTQAANNPLAYQLVTDVPDNGFFVDVIQELDHEYAKAFPFEHCFIVDVNGPINVYFSAYTPERLGHGSGFDLTTEETASFLETAIGECH